MFVRYANIDGKVRKVYVFTTYRQPTLFGDVKFLSTISTSKTGSNPQEYETSKLLKDKPKHRKIKEAN